MRSARPSVQSRGSKALSSFTATQARTARAWSRRWSFPLRACLLTPSLPILPRPMCTWPVATRSGSPLRLLNAWRRCATSCAARRSGYSARSSTSTGGGVGWRRISPRPGSPRRAPRTTSARSPAASWPSCGGPPRCCERSDRMRSRTTSSPSVIRCPTCWRWQCSSARSACCVVAP